MIQRWELPFFCIISIAKNNLNKTPFWWFSFIFTLVSCRVVSCLQKARHVLSCPAVSCLVLLSHFISLIISWSDFLGYFSFHYNWLIITLNSLCFLLFYFFSVRTVVCHKTATMRPSYFIFCFFFGFLQNMFHLFIRFSFWNQHESNYDLMFIVSGKWKWKWAVNRLLLWLGEISKVSGTINSSDSIWVALFILFHSLAWRGWKKIMELFFLVNLKDKDKVLSKEDWNNFFQNLQGCHDMMKGNSSFSGVWIF